MSSRSEQESTVPSQSEQKPNRPADTTPESESIARGADDDSAKVPPEPDGPTTTVMIYMAGDNNLSEECIYALTELKEARASRLVRIYVQFDPGDEFLPTQRYEINRYGPHTYKNPIAEDLIDQLDQYRFRYESRKRLRIRPPFGERRERKGEGGTGDPKMLYNFVAFCVDEPHKPHPTKTDHYVLIICGHGAGVQRDYLLRDNRPDGYLTINELRWTLQRINKTLRGKGKDFNIDIFGMDVCLMSMAEITYELRGLVKIAIGCESYSPAAGWPYLETIKQIEGYARQANASSKRKATTALISPKNWESIAANIVKTYVRFYSDYWLGGLSVTMSALRVRRVYELQRLIRALADVMIDKLRIELDSRKAKLHSMETDYGYGYDCQTDKENHKRKNSRYPPLLFSDALILAHWRAQSYNGELYVDVADFCNCLAEYAPRDIASQCRRLARFIEREFTIESCSFGRSYQYSYGVSIYFPWQTLVPYYGASIYFPGDSHWLRFLKIYLDVTRRTPRLFNGALDVKALIRKNFSDVRMGPDKMGPDKGLDEGGNPIHSMRNPPIVFIPDCCTDDNVRLSNANAQERLMREVKLRKLLPDPGIKALENRKPDWILQSIDSPKLEIDDDDES